jgi:hypothetical protein
MRMQDKQTSSIILCPKNSPEETFVQIAWDFATATSGWHRGAAWEDFLQERKEEQNFQGPKLHLNRSCEKNVPTHKYSSWTINRTDQLHTAGTGLTYI